MTAKVTVEEVERVAELAHLELTPEETPGMLNDLNAILDYVAELNELDTTGVTPLAQVSELKNAAGESVLRETALPGAVLTRVASSHIRVGTFQFFAARGDTEGVRRLADHVIARHYPQASGVERPYHALLDGVIARQAQLIAQWMLLGFIHGVMNTDNTSISGETIDYGPCAFMEAYDPATVFSSIDHGGRYAYGNQPSAALWNLARLAEALLLILAQEAGSEEAAVAAANEALSGFEPQYQQARMAGLRRKLGLFTEREGDEALAEDLLERMAANRADFTLTFRRLSDATASPDGDAAVRTLFTDPGAYDGWAAEWRGRRKMTAPRAAVT